MSATIVGLLVTKCYDKVVHRPQYRRPADREEYEDAGKKLIRSQTSSSAETEDEADWSGDEQHDDYSPLDGSEDLQTIADAEDRLLKHIDSIVHCHNSDEDPSLVKKLLRTNCPHRGDIEHAEGKRWLVAVDGSEASKRAFHGVLKLMDPTNDHLLVVTVRDKNLPRRYSLTPREELQLRFELWKSARHILKPFREELETRLNHDQYTVMVPEAWDVRRLLCNLCKRHKIDSLCVGKHSESERNHHHWHLLSLRSYVNKHAGCQVIVF